MKKKILLMLITLLFVASTMTSYAGYMEASSLDASKIKIGTFATIEAIEEATKNKADIDITEASKVAGEVFKTIDENPDTTVKFDGEDFYWTFISDKTEKTYDSLYSLGITYSDPLDYRIEMILPNDKVEWMQVRFYKEEILPIEGILTVETPFEYQEKIYGYSYDSVSGKATPMEEEIAVDSMSRLHLSIKETKNFFVTNEPL